MSRLVKSRRAPSARSISGITFWTCSAARVARSSSGRPEPAGGRRSGLGMGAFTLSGRSTWSAPPKGDPEQDEEKCQQQSQAEQDRSEEHTSELQSRSALVCRLLLEKKKNKK